MIKEMERDMTFTTLFSEKAYSGTKAIHRTNEVKEQYIISCESFIPSGSFRVLMANPKHAIISRNDHPRQTK